MNPATSLVLNTLRWSAAFLVLIGHARHLVLVDYGQVEKKNFLLKGIYFLTGFGHEAVIVFFVISGFLVGGMTLERWRIAGVDMRAYWVARVSRIYTVVVPALVLGLVLDLVGSRWFDGAGLYSNPEALKINSLDNSLLGNLDIATFAGNLAMLQGILVGNLGSNSPLWSLSYEWWYYMLFALGAIAFFEGGRGRWLAGAAGLLLMALLPVKLLLWGSFWLLGLLTFRWTCLRKTPLPFWAGAAAFLSLFLVSRLTHNTENLANHESLAAEYVRDMAVGSGVALLIASTATASFVLTRLNQVSTVLADFSYSTYLVHFPAMLLLAALFARADIFGVQMQPTAGALAYLAGLVVALLGISFGFSRLTEIHTHAVRSFLLRQFRRGGTASI